MGIITMRHIESLTQKLADARIELAARVGVLNDEITEAKRRHLSRIKHQVGVAKAAREALQQGIEAHPELFVKPRTVTLHGIRVGYMKQKGKIEFDDAGQVVKLIRKHFPERFDVLVKTSETPAKEALEQLSAADLKRLGVSVSEDTDAVLIKDTAGDVDKIVAALLKEDEE